MKPLPPLLLAALASCVQAGGPAGYDKQVLDPEFRAEGASFADFNRDGKPDVVAGPWWYEGPAFTSRQEVRKPQSFKPENYSDNFLTHTGDFNADGWPDILYIPFPGKASYWYENPGRNGGEWKPHLAFPVTDNESPQMVDMDADGRLDLLFNTGGQMGYATYDPARPDQVWQFKAVSPKKHYHKWTHGIGAGDVNGDGRIDLVEATGWWEQPAKPAADGFWTFHPFTFAEAGAQMYVYDVDGDGKGDLITSWHCHLYGLLWWKQVRDAQGVIGWQRQVILDPKPDLKSPDLRISQMHAMALVDINGDGLKDLVTGKRWWAHGPKGDVETNNPAVVYWFELQRTNDGARFIPHLVDSDSGVGTQVEAADLNGDGIPDILVSNKKGSALHLSRPRN
ncbi:MAG: hypothetical protein RL095_3352 [Verrucomicrobiota bacterium]|jgi:hypothetical protein